MIAVTVTDSLSTFLRVLRVDVYLSNVQTGLSRLRKLWLRIHFSLVTFVATWRATSSDLLWAPNIFKYVKQNQTKQVNLSA